MRLSRYYSHNFTTAIPFKRLVHMQIVFVSLKKGYKVNLQRKSRRQTSVFYATAEEKTFDVFKSH